MEQANKRCIIVGASHAAAQMAPALRQQGWEGEILIIGDEPHLPYHRPPLSKTFLSGEKSIDQLAIRPSAFYDKNNITFKVGCVSNIDRDKKCVYLENGESIAYDKLALCTGANVNKIDLPGVGLEGIHYLRNAQDVEGIQQSIKTAKNVVMIGAGYIGLETAAALKKLGKQVVVLDRCERILERVTSPEISQFYSRVHAEEGVEIHNQVVITEFKGRTSVESVVCEDGRTFKADVVIIGIGVAPRVDLAEEAGLSVERGILVDEFCQTSDPDIVAAGDCTNHINLFYQHRMHLESVPNANEQAKVAAASICGDEKPYNCLPWFWSDQYDLKLQIAGLSEGYDQLVVRGDIESSRSFSVFYFKQGKLIASDCINRPKEFMLSKKVISQGLDVDPAALADESVDLKDIDLKDIDLKDSKLKDNKLKDIA